MKIGDQARNSFNFSNCFTYFHDRRLHGLGPLESLGICCDRQEFGLDESLGPASLARVPKSDQVFVIALNPGVELRFCRDSCFSPRPVRMAMADYNT